MMKYAKYILVAAIAAFLGWAWGDNNVRSTVSMNLQNVISRSVEAPNGRCITTEDFKLIEFFSNPTWK